MGAVKPGRGVDVRDDDIRVRFTWQGQRRGERLGLRPTQKNLLHAERLLHTIREEIRLGVFDYAKHFPESETATAAATADGAVACSFDHYADLYLTTLTGSVSKLKTYTVAVGFWKRAFDGRMIADLKVSDIRVAVAEQAQRVAGSSVNLYMVPLRAIFELALADEVIGANPAASIKRLSHQLEEPDPLEAEERDRVIAWMKSHRAVEIAAYFEFAFQTGLRPSELIALRWSRIDWTRKSMRIDRAKVEGVEAGTKSRRVRHVALNDRALAVLKLMRPLTALMGPDAHVFVSPEGREPWANAKTLCRDHWHAALKALGLAKRDAYQTRHSYATLLLMADENINLGWLSKQLGHAQITTTLKHYARWVDARDNGTQAERANAAIGQIGPALVPISGQSLKSLRISAT